MSRLSEGIFECPVCFEESVPFMIACGHSGCEICFGKVKSCPICRMQLSNSYKPIKNIELVGVLDFLKTASKVQIQSSPENLYFTDTHWENIVGPEFVDNIYLLDWRYPTQVQSRVIPKIVHGKNLIVESWNGTGKTGTFVIGALCRVFPQISELQVICVSHTKEIKDMHFEIFKKLSKNTEIQVAKTIKYENIENFSHVLCGTTDSVNKYLRKKNIEYSTVLVIIDECDEILKDLNRSNTLKLLLKKIKQPQILLFSATLNEEVRNFMKEFQDFEEVKISEPEVINPKIGIHNISITINKSKPSLVHELLKSIPFSLCIVFINSKIDLDILYHDLLEKGYKSEIFTGDLESHERETVIEKAQRGFIKVLLSTDVLGRGFDCNRIDLVINYECPKIIHSPNSPNFEAFYHRCGRTGRYNRTGTVVNIINKGEFALYSKIFERFKIPAKISNLADIIQNVQQNMMDYENLT